MHVFEMGSSRKVGDLPTENSSDGITSVAMQQWNVEQRVFAV